MLGKKTSLATQARLYENDKAGGLKELLTPVRATAGLLRDGPEQVTATVWSLVAPLESGGLSRTMRTLGTPLVEGSLKRQTRTSLRS
jgi:hypothetical protein